MKEDGLSKIVKQLVGVIISLTVLGTALLWIGRTEFVCKDDADRAAKEVQCQIVEQNRTIAVIDKTTALTGQKVDNIEKAVNRIERLVK